MRNFPHNAGIESNPKSVELPERTRAVLSPSAASGMTPCVFLGLITKVDGGTMHYALEARSPLLDQEIWNFAATLPFSVRLHGGELKAILREIARRRIGPAIARRKKRGFTIPVQEWLPAWKSDLGESLHHSLLEREGWIAPGALAHAFDLRAATGHAPNQLWYLMTLEHWMRHERSAPATLPRMPVLVGQSA